MVVSPRVMPRAELLQERLACLQKSYTPLAPVKRVRQVVGICPNKPIALFGGYRNPRTPRVLHLGDDYPYSRRPIDAVPVLERERRLLVELGAQREDFVSRLRVP